jgi:hypothetical protein
VEAAVNILQYCFAWFILFGKHLKLYKIPASYLFQNKDVYSCAPVSTEKKIEN